VGADYAARDFTTNKAVIAATAAAGIPGPATAYMEDPRTYGVRVTLKY
jgi:iron complex outermembrane recepter protein